MISSITKVFPSLKVSLSEEVLYADRDKIIFNIYSRCSLYEQTELGFFSIDQVNKLITQIIHKKNYSLIEKKNSVESLSYQNNNSYLTLKFAKLNNETGLEYDFKFLNPEETHLIKIFTSLLNKKSSIVLNRHPFFKLELHEYQY